MAASDGVPCRFPQVLPLLLCLFFALTIACSAAAQVVELKAGSSSLFRTSGATVSFTSANYQGWIGAGDHDGFVEGFFFSAPLADGFVGLGDQEIPYSLPTDIFNPFVYFLGRGAGWNISSARGTFRIFGGYTSERFGTPFLLTAQPDRFAAAVFYSRPVTNTLTYSADIVYSGKGTFLQSLSYKPAESFSLAITGGASGRDPYGAASLEFHQPRADFKASYTQTGDSFRRIALSSPLSVEYDRENLSLDLRPARFLSVNFSRQNILAPDTTSGPGMRARVSGAGLFLNVRKLRLHGSVFRSSGTNGRTDAFMAGAERAITRRVSANVDYFRSIPHDGNRSSSVAAGVREKLSARLQLSQILQFGLNQKTFGFGGSYESHAFSVGLDYQTIYIPFYIPGQPSFRQVALVHLRWLMPHDIEIHAESNVTPVGTVKYTAYGSAIEYSDGSSGSGASAARAKLNDCVVRGRVRDENQTPLSGIALRIGDELAFTDSDGIFFVRTRKCAQFPLALAPDDSLNPYPYEPVSIPKTVFALPESASSELTILLRRSIHPSSPSQL